MPLTTCRILGNSHFSHPLLGNNNFCVKKFMSWVIFLTNYLGPFCCPANLLFHSSFFNIPHKTLFRFSLFLSPWMLPSQSNPQTSSLAGHLLIEKTEITGANVPQFPSCPPWRTLWGFAHILFFLLLWGKKLRSKTLENQNNNDQNIQDYREREGFNRWPPRN